MSTIPLSVGGIVYNYPRESSEGWGIDASNWALAITQNALQKSGGLFTLTNDVDFGAVNGIKSLYYKSRSSNIATIGNVRLANSDFIAFRNSTNSANLSLQPGSADGLIQYAGVDLVNISSPQTVSNKTLVSATFPSATFTNPTVTGGTFTSPTIIGGSFSGQFTSGTVALSDGLVATPSLSFASELSTGFFRDSSGSFIATVLGSSKLQISTDLIAFTNFDIRQGGSLKLFGDGFNTKSVNLSAPIAIAATYNIVFPAAAPASNSVLGYNGTDYVWTPVAGSFGITQLTGNVTAGPGAGSQVATIAAGVIVNSMVSGSAAIVYSKLSLSNSIVNADISTSAAISLSKLATITASRVLQSDGSGVISASSVTNTELGYVSGVTSSIQSQLNTKITNGGNSFGADFIIGSTDSNLVNIINNNVSAIEIQGDSTQITIFPDASDLSAGLFSVSGKLSAAAAFITVSSTNSSTGTLNDLSVTAKSSITFSNNTGPTVTGFDPASGGQELTIVYTGTGTMVLANMNAGSAATHRIYTGNGADLTVPQYGSVTLKYVSANRWVVTAISFITTAQVKGTDTNNSAAAGYVGEYISAVPGATVAPSTTGVPKTITSISLTAGDWDVYGGLRWVPGTATGNTYVACYVSLTNNAADSLLSDSTAVLTSIGSDTTISTGPRRISIATTTTVYLTGEVNFSAIGTGAYNVQSKLWARRVR